MKRFFFSLTASILLLSACHTTEPEKDTQTFVDDYQRSVVVPQNPQRIVSASPAVTEIIFAIGAQDLLVGRTDYCTYPPEAEKITSIGGISNLNVEMVLSLNPDLMIGGSMIPAASIEQAQKLGLPSVCITERNSFSQLYDNIRNIGFLTCHVPQADSLCKLLQQEVAALNIDTAQRPTAYYVVGFGNGGDYTAGGNTFINDIIRLAGGQNIAEQISGWRFSREALMAADPEFILIREEDSAAFCSAKPYCSLSAVKKHHVVGLPSGLLDGQGPRNIEAIKLIASAINNSNATF